MPEESYTLHISGEDFGNHKTHCLLPIRRGSGDPVERQRLSEEQFWELYAVSQSHLVRFARRICSDRMLAEDAVADAFVSVLKTIRKPGDSGPTRETFISYLRVCIRHEVARLSRRWSVEETNADVEAQLEGQQLVDHVDDRLTDVEVWDGDVAKRAFGALSDRDRALLLLTEVEKHPLAEVAQSQGMTAQAVAAATYRARDALRTNYLIEAVSEDPTCPNMRVDFLAAFARGKAPSVRRRKIEAHLDRCERCPDRLQKMLSYRVPVAVVAVLALGGGVVVSGNTSAPASAVEPIELEIESARILGAARVRGAAFVGGGALLLLLAGLVTWLLTASLSGSAGQAPGSSGSGLAGKGTSDAGNAPAKTGPDASDDTSAPGEASGDTSGDGSGSGTNGNGSGNDEQKSNEEEREKNKDDGLPPGVRSASWLTPPANYVAGGRDAKLLLAVEFDPDTEPSDYVVEVRVPSGVRVTRASAGCVIASNTVTCTPTSTMLNLRLFNFQFFTDLTADAALPDVSVMVL